jgi:hypothetical protein
MTNSWRRWSGHVVCKGWRAINIFLGGKHDRKESLGRHERRWNKIKLTLKKEI